MFNVSEFSIFQYYLKFRFVRYFGISSIIGICIFDIFGILLKKKKKKRYTSSAVTLLFNIIRFQLTTAKY